MSTEVSAPRRILIIQTDAQHHQWLGFRDPTGRIRTPHLDALARERAVVFDHAYTCSGVCVPSRVSFHSGRYPIGHGVMSNNIAPHPPNEPWLGKLLHDAGMATGYFGKTHFAGNDRDLASEGWDTSFIKYEYNAYLQENGVDVTYPEGKEIERQPVRYWNIGASRIPCEHYFENVIADQAIGFMRAHRDESFCCYVSNVAPHGPFTPPKPYDTMYDPKDLVLPPRFEDEIEGKPAATQRWIEQNRKYQTEEELRIWLASVYGLTSLVDDNVGRLVGALGEMGLLDSTMIVFLSDHGDFGGRYGILGKSWCMIDDLVRIPLMIALPGVRVDRNDALVQSIDVTATMLEWAGAPISSRIHGRSLLPLLRGEADQVRDRAFICDQAQYSGDHLFMSAVRTKDWKYIESTGGDGELYHVAEDRYERNNRVDDPSCAAMVDGFRRDLLRWHLDHSGGFYEPTTAGYWEDETCFYDESMYCGERIKKSKGGTPNL